MAIAYARAEFVKRSEGRQAAQLSAYISRDERTAERTGESFDYSRRSEDLIHTEMLLPPGSPQRLRNPNTFWNEVEAAEDRSTRRANAQLGRHIVLALPKEAELSDADRIAMTRRFVEKHFVSKGLGVEIALHRPHGEDGAPATEGVNWHAHVFVSDRRITDAGFAATKARDLLPVVRKGRVVDESQQWGKLWQEFQNWYFQEQGLALRVDPTRMIPMVHEGAARHAGGADQAEINAARRAEGDRMARSPAAILEKLTYHQSTFSERDVARLLSCHGIEGEEFQRLKIEVMGNKRVVPLFDQMTGQAGGIYTTREVLEQERTTIERLGRLAGRRGFVVPVGIPAQIAAGKELSADQRAALDAATGAGGLVLIEGHAGAGKSYTMNEVRESYEAAGYRVIGLTPQNSVAADMRKAGFSGADTVHAALGRLERGKENWDRRTVVIVDEAGMVDTIRMDKLTRALEASGAKGILIGDRRQLASVQRGGMFAAAADRFGVVQLFKVRRQKADWAKQASANWRAGRHLEALRAYEANGAIRFSDTHDEARRALVAQWAADCHSAPEKSRFVFAHRNADVNALNAEIRAVRKARGEVRDQLTVETTRRGLPAETITLGAGDKIQFHDSRKRDGIYSGEVGEVRAVRGVVLEVETVGGQRLAIDTREFLDFSLGYAGTVYRGQGKTLDQAYVYYRQSRYFGNNLSYVAMTRHREHFAMFVSREDAQGVEQLAAQMQRAEGRATSLDYVTGPEARGREEWMLQGEVNKAREIRALAEEWRRAATADNGAAATAALRLEETVRRQGVSGEVYATFALSGPERDAISATMKSATGRAAAVATLPELRKLEAEYEAATARPLQLRRVNTLTGDDPTAEFARVAEIEQARERWASTLSAAWETAATDGPKVQAAPAAAADAPELQAKSAALQSLGRAEIGTGSRVNEFSIAAYNARNEAAERYLLARSHVARAENVGLAPEHVEVFRREAAAQATGAAADPAARAELERLGYDQQLERDASAASKAAEEISRSAAGDDWRREAAKTDHPTVKAYLEAEGKVRDAEAFARKRGLPVGASELQQLRHVAAERAAAVIHDAKAMQAYQRLGYSREQIERAKTAETHTARQAQSEAKWQSRGYRPKL